MIAYVDSTGKVLAGTFGDSEQSLQGITHLPDGASYAVYVDDTQFPNAFSDLIGLSISNVTPSTIYFVPTATGTPVYTPTPDSVKLSGAQKTKIAQLSAARDNAIFSSFQSSALGTLNTYTADDRARMRYDAVLNRMMRDSSYTSESIYTHESGWMAHNLQQVTQLVDDGMKHEQDQWAKWKQLVQQVQQATTVDAVNAIQWT